MRTINIHGNLWDLDESPLVMGILNITPDSFYAASRKQEIKDALARVEEILEQGGNIIDIGAQSTRPNANLLSEEEELERLTPILDTIQTHFPSAVISLDTFYSKVSKIGVEKYNVAIINDISGGEIDDNMFETVASLHVPYILTHMRGTPQTMHKMNIYKNLIQEISFYFSEKIAKLHLLGVKDIILDPGFGFAKNTEQNFELMSHLSFFENFNVPLLIGISRKSMICKALNISAENALNGTSVLNTYSLLNGADILRVHDVKEAAEAIKLTQMLKSKPLLQ